MDQPPDHRSTVPVVIAVTPIRSALADVQNRPAYCHRGVSFFGTHRVSRVFDPLIILLGYYLSGVGSIRPDSFIAPPVFRSPKIRNAGNDLFLCGGKGKLCEPLFDLLLSLNLVRFVVNIFSGLANGPRIFRTRFFRSFRNSRLFYYTRLNHKQIPMVERKKLHY